MLHANVHYGNNATGMRAEKGQMDELVGRLDVGVDRNAAEIT
jgi:hypothetical protein